eukprot:226771_1
MMKRKLKNFNHSNNIYKCMATNSTFEDDEKKTETLTVEQYALGCEGLCNMKYNPSQLFFCHHKDCDNENKKMLCAECGHLSHRNGKHSFTTNSKSVQQLLVPDQKEYKFGKQTAAALKKHSEKMQHLIWNQRWHAVESSATLLTSLGVCVGKSMVEFARYSSYCVGKECLKSISSNSPWGNVIGIGLEWGYIWYRYQGKQISKKEAIALTSASVASTLASTAAAFKLSGFTDELIKTGSLHPYAAVGVTIIGAIIVGICVRYGMDHLWQKWFVDEEQDARTALQKEALKYFFGTENYDIDDEKKFNEKLLKRTYRRMALICHPDTKDGNDEEWLKLCSYYGILTRICEYKIEAKNKNKDDVHVQTTQNSSDDEKAASLKMAKESASTSLDSINKDIPEKYICPITHQIMYDPVIAFDGFCYEKNAIENYLKMHKKSPKTGADAPYLFVFPNHQCKANITKFIKANNIISPKHDGKLQKKGNETDFM